MPYAIKINHKRFQTIAATNFLDSKGDCFNKGEFMIVDLTTINKDYKKYITKINKLTNTFESEMAECYSAACSEFLSSVCESGEVEFDSFIYGLHRIKNAKSAINLMLSKEDLKTMRLQEKAVDKLILEYISPAGIIVMPPILGEH